MHTKVFVGNLSFKTKADELAAEFSPAGRVVSANIITRGPRSLGYGFVELESEEEARKAVTLLNKRSVDGREINVEIAKPRDEAKIAERRQARDSGPRRGGRRGGRGRGFEGAPADSGSSSNNNANPSANASSPSNAPQGDAPRSGFGGRGRRSFRPRGGAAAPAGGSTAGGAPGSSSAPGDSSAPPRERRPRGPRGPRGPPRNRDLNTRTASNTTLFVANLPFALDDAGLAALFKDNKVAKAHVVKNRNNRSKGFGFVEFETEADQKAALASAEKLTVDTRQLIVKIALTPPEGLGAPQAPAATSAAPTEKEPAPKDAKAEAPKSS